LLITSYQLGLKMKFLAIQQKCGHFAFLVDALVVTAKRCVISFPQQRGVQFGRGFSPNGRKRTGFQPLEFEAKKYSPLALSEVDLSWSVGKRCPGIRQYRKGTAYGRT